jgi:hypothetical protein
MVSSAETFDFIDENLGCANIVLIFGLIIEAEVDDGFLDIDDF